jgi:hypothetical protein
MKLTFPARNQLTRFIWQSKAAGHLVSLLWSGQLEQGEPGIKL